MPTWCANAADAANREPCSPDYTLPGRPMTERGGAIWQNASAPGALLPARLNQTCCVRRYLA